MFTINSRKLGKKVKFHADGEAIYVDFEKNKPGTLGQQLCRSGSLMGSTIICPRDCSQEHFEKVCRTWFRQYLKNSD